MIYFGINLGSTVSKKVLKDGSASLITDEKDIFSVAEERLTGVKAKGGFINSLEKVKTFVSHQKEDTFSITISSCCETLDNSEMNTPEILKNSKVMHFIGHHYSHALASFSFSGFDNALVAIWDCGGDYYKTKNNDSLNWWEFPREQHSYYLINKSTAIPLEDDFDFTQPFEMGFGEVYRALTHLLGFDSYIHSSKAMALAAYGNKTRFEGSTFFFFDNNTGKISNELKYKSNNTYKNLIQWAETNLNLKLKRHTGDESRAKDLLDFAYFIQNEMIRVSKLKIDFLIRKYRISNVCLGGGVSLNCVMNSEIRKLELCDNLFIPPGCGDIGQSMGNAIFGYFSQNKNIPDLSRNSIYIGSEIIIDRKLKNQFGDYHYECLDSKSLTSIAAYLLNNNHIIGWAQGRSEWGPRALGNRSILCSSENVELAEALRKKIKFRNSFEPFAVSILENDFKEYFNSKAASLPYMLEVVTPIKGKEKMVKNSLHIDNTCRVQTVNSEQNPILYSLLQEYKKITNSSVVLNTSLNHRGKPICETATDCFYFFVSTNLQIIFIGNYLIVKDKKIIEEISNLGFLNNWKDKILEKK